MSKRVGRSSAQKRVDLILRKLRPEWFEAPKITKSRKSAQSDKALGDNNDKENNGESR